MNRYEVETYNTETGEVVHGFSFNTVGPETARSQYMKQPERPRCVEPLAIRVTRAN